MWRAGATGSAKSLKTAAILVGFEDLRRFLEVAEEEAREEEAEGVAAKGGESPILHSGGGCGCGGCGGSEGGVMEAG